MIRVLRVWVLLVYALLPVMVSGQATWVTPIKDFSGGIMPSVSPSAMPPNSMLIGENFILRGNQLELRKGYSVWTGLFDAPTDHGVRRMHEFHSSTTGKTQVMAVVHDEIWYRSNANTIMRRLAISTGDINVLADSITVFGSATNWLMEIFPEDASGWEIRPFYDGAYDSVRTVRKIISDNEILLHEAYSIQMLSADYQLYPVYDTTNTTQFETVRDVCLIADGVQPVKRWKNETFDPSYYVVDSAVVDSAYFFLWGGGFGGAHSFVVFGTPLNGGPFGFSSVGWGADDQSDYAIPEYADYNYCLMVYDEHWRRWLRMPIINEWNSVDSAYTAPPRRNRVGIFADSVQLEAIWHEGQTAYVVLPATEAFSFLVDTIYTGDIDSMVSVPCSTISTSMKYNLVYDDGVLNDESFADLHTAPYIFKVTSGIDSNRIWWQQGALCFFEVDSTRRGGAPTYDTILCVMKPLNDINNGAIPPLADGTEYTILKLHQYPCAKYLGHQATRTWFLGSPHNSNIMYMSALYDETDVNVTDFIEVGAEDNENVSGMGGLYDQRWIYKEHRTYAQVGNHPDEVQTRLRQNQGIWSDGFILAYKNMEYGVNNTGLVAFDGSSMNNFSSAVETFFEDSININRLDLVRGEILNDNLLFSYPSTGSTKNDRSLWFDIETKSWMTSTLVGASYLKLTSPAGNDSILIGDTDSAKIYVYGGTDDDGSEIVGRYKSPYFDFGAAHIKKTLQKILISCELDSNASLWVSIYGDTLTAETWRDTITSITPALYWEERFVTLPRLPEYKRFALEIRTSGADTLRIDLINMRIRTKGEAGGK